ncbi:hypothetical protein D3C85_1479880 [compost metagenome]
MKAMTVVCARWAEDDISSSGLDHTYDFGEFNIITGQHCNGALLSLEYLNPIPRGHVPLMNLGGGNMKLGLLRNPSIRVEQVRCII